jgi:tetratricopeptide (TPR) repeat protein
MWRGIVTTGAERSNVAGYTSGMRLTKGLLILSCAAALAAHAAPSPELLDLAARVNYGYYTAEPRAIDAAIAALERLTESPDVLYYRDFAALRRAQLGELDRAGQQRLRACVERDVAPGLDKRFASEVWVLVAACAEVAEDKGRRERALSLARERDDDNPRIALVEAWALDREAGTDAVAEKLAAVVEAFEAWAPALDDPEWGHAEALTALAADALQRGQARAARDLIERALLLAPDYRAALELRTAMQNARAGERRL